MGFLFEDELGFVDIFEAGLLLAVGFVEVFGFGGGGGQGEIPAVGHVINYIFRGYIYLLSWVEVPLSDDISDSPSEHDEI